MFDVFRRITTATLFAPEGRAAFSALSTVADAPPSEPAGGEAPPPSDGEGQPSHDGSDPGDENDRAQGSEPTRRAGDEPDDDDDEDVDDPAAPLDQRFKQVAKSLNKHKRRAAKMAPTVRALRDAGVTDVRAFLTEAQEARQIVAALKKDPKAFVQALGLSTAKDEPAAPPARDADDFDPKSLPFDVSEDDPLTTFMADLAKQVHTLSRENARLKQGFTQEQASKQRQAEAVQRKEWSTAITQAEAELPEHLRVVFRDAMTSAFHLRHQHRQPAAKIVDHYLGALRKSKQITDKTERIASAAARERGATANTKTWPSHPVGGGVPAPAARPKRMGLAALGRKIRAGDFAGTSLATPQ